MKKQMMVLVVLLVSLVFQIMGQVPTVVSTDPHVPWEIALRGRQQVTAHLMKEVDRVTIRYSGRSTWGHWNDLNIDRDMLSNLGYIHDGQFSELSEALGSAPFSGEVIKAPTGDYEVWVSLNFYNTQYKMVLSGSGYLNIQEGSRGELTVGTFEPFVGIPWRIIVDMPNITEARWIGEKFEDIHLEMVQDSNGRITGFYLPVGYLGNGNFVVASEKGGMFKGWSLRTGEALPVLQVITMLGKLKSSDIVSVTDDQQVDKVSEMFYRWEDGRIYGRFALRDVVTVGRKELIDIQVPIWGTSEKIRPTQMFITPVYLGSPNTMGLVPGTQYEVQRRDDGTFPLVLPSGGYHIEFTFPQVWDWDTVGGKG